MIEFTEYHEPRETKNVVVQPITFTKETMEAIKMWNQFLSANRQMINHIFNQTDIHEALRLSIGWWHECIRLGKLFYRIDETTNQVYNNAKILTNNVLTGNAIELDRTFITTFTNVAKYQKEVD